MIRKAPSPVPFEGGLECRPGDRAAPALVCRLFCRAVADRIAAGIRGQGGFGITALIVLRLLDLFSLVAERVLSQILSQCIAQRKGNAT
jgi:hypothetical protein